MFPNFENIPRVIHTISQIGPKMSWDICPRTCILFLKATLSEICCSLLGRDNFSGQISVHIFAPNDMEAIAKILFRERERDKEELFKRES